MDDEEMVRELTGEILMNFGYKVEFAKDGVEAIELYKSSQKSGKPFDAVIMDLTIPGGMGGKEAIRKIAEINPEAKAIISSGYSDDPVMANYKDYGFSAIIAKPYKIEELGKKLRLIIQQE